MQVVPKPNERADLARKIHRDMGHYGIHRVLDRLKLNYWWKGMEETVVEVIRACMPCARTKAGFRTSGKELQPLKMQGLMYRWGVDFAGPLFQQLAVGTGSYWYVSNTARSGWS